LRKLRVGNLLVEIEIEIKTVLSLPFAYGRMWKQMSSTGCLKCHPIFSCFFWPVLRILHNFIFQRQNLCLFCIAKDCFWQTYGDSTFGLKVLVLMKNCQIMAGRTTKPSMLLGGAIVLIYRLI